MHRLLVIGATSLVALALSGAAQAWSWPADGDVLRPYTLGGDAYAAGQHRGIDVAGPDGSPIRAPASGTVSFAGSLPTYGRGVTILTDDGYAVTLVHLGAIGVAKGDAVTEGSPVGTMGSSGEPEHPVPSVHLGIRVASESEGYVDPLGLLPSRPAPVPSPQPAPAPVTAPVAGPVPAPAPPAPPAPGPTPAAASPSAPPASAPSPPATTAAVATPPPAESPAAAAAVPVPEARPPQSIPLLPGSPTPAAKGGGSSTADERLAAAAPEPVGAVPTVVASSDTVQARHGEVATPVHMEHRSRVAMEAARQAQPTRAAVGDAVAPPAVVAPRIRGEEAAPSAARADAVAAPTRPGAVASPDVPGGRVALARKEAPRSGDSPDQLEAGALPPRMPVGGEGTSAPVPGVARASVPSSARIVSRLGETTGPRLPVAVAAVALLALIAVGAGRWVARRIGLDGAVLRHDADLLRQLDAAHRPRLHDRGRGRLRTPSAAARP